MGCLRRAGVLLALASVAALGGCAGGGRGTGEGPAVVAGAPIEGREGFFRAGALSLGGQPEMGQLGAFREEGIATVINLRSHEEMGDLLAEDGVDEATAVRAAGMEYVHIPLGGDDGYEPADVEAFAGALEGAKGPVLVHCASGARARTMWQAYLITRRGYSLAEAEEVTATLGGGPSPLERLLGRDVRSRLGGSLGEAP